MHIKKLNRQKPYTIRSVTHALDLLEQFHGDDAAFSLGDLSRRLDLPKNKIFRLLATLAQRNYIEHDLNTENYCLGLKNIEIGQAVVRQRRCFNNVRPLMESLAKGCKETICLSMLRDYHSVNLHVVEGRNPLRVVQRPGGVVPAYCTSAGKAQIAYLAADSLNHYLRECQFQRYTPSTITDPQRLLDQLRQISRQGYALDSEELELGVMSVSAPVRDYTTNTVSAITCYVPSMLANNSRVEEELIPFILKSAHAISAMLGYAKSVRTSA